MCMLCVCVCAFSFVLSACGSACAQYCMLVVVRVVCSAFYVCCVCFRQLRVCTCRCCVSFVCVRL